MRQLLALLLPHLLALLPHLALLPYLPSATSTQPPSSPSVPTSCPPSSSPSLPVFRQLFHRRVYPFFPEHFYIIAPLLYLLQLAHSHSSNLSICPNLHTTSFITPFATCTWAPCRYLHLSPLSLPAPEPLVATCTWAPCRYLHVSPLSLPAPVPLEPNEVASVRDSIRAVHAQLMVCS
jgi:hypothetical protein